MAPQRVAVLAIVVGEAHGSRVLEDFINANREAIIARTRERFLSRTSRSSGHASAIPTFVDQLCDALRLARSTASIDHEDISARAGRHGTDLLQRGFTIAQVVHDYGDVCQVVTELATERAAPISGDEFRTLNLCLDDAIAGAVTAHAEGRQRAITLEATERLGMLAHELRNRVNAAILSFDVIKSGRVAVSGSTGLLLGRSLHALRDLVDRSLAGVRVDAGIRTFQRIALADLLQEAEVSVTMQAESHDVRVLFVDVDASADVDGDRQLLSAALANLLQNALKFTPRRGTVELTTHVTSDRVVFDIADECGGLPEGTGQILFQPFEQRGSDRSGVGLGLVICKKIAAAHGGELRVRDIPGKGCVFSLDIPRRTIS